MAIGWARFLGVAAVGVLAAGCEAGPAGPSEPTTALEATLDAMAAEANRDGDPDVAAGFSGGALALRLGVRPSEIVVQVGDESARYQALVYGVVRALRDGDLVLSRALIAWAGDRPVALLHVSQVTDEAAFAWPADLTSAADPRGRGHGTWSDRATGHRWVATSGSSSIVLTESGDPCLRQLASNPGLRCAVARYDIRVDGEFYRLLRRDARETDRSRTLEISTSAAGVNGVVIEPLER